MASTAYEAIIGVWCGGFQGRSPFGQKVRKAKPPEAESLSYGTSSGSSKHALFCLLCNHNKLILGYLVLSVQYLRSCIAHVTNSK